MKKEIEKTAAERLEIILSEIKMSKNALSKELGYTNNVGLTNISKGTYNFSAEMAKRITDKFPQFNYDWITKGKQPMIKGKNIQQVGEISGNKNQLIHGEEVNIHHDEGKDLVLAEKDKEVKKMFEALLEELHGFHAIGERRDKYIARQDEYIASVIKHSYLRNDENMKRMDKLFGQQGELIQKIDNLIRLVDRQNQKVEERADRILDMLGKKL